jgi:hypothetical protein
MKSNPIAFFPPRRGLDMTRIWQSKMKTMRPKSKTFPRSRTLAGEFLAAVAVILLSTAHAFAADVNVTYVTGAEVPVSSNGFTALDKTVHITLNYAPTPGTQLMVVRNTGAGIIRGNFSNLGQGQTVALNFGGTTYHFVANYYGGNGNDLVLLWTGPDSAPPAIVRKLDPQLLLALKKSRGQAPFDKPTTLKPDIAGQDGARVLVDVEASVSKELLSHVALVGGQVIDGSATATTFRAMVPLSQLETLAGGEDTKFISVARPTITSVVRPTITFGSKP